jgi:hypothetical protein
MGRQTVKVNPHDMAYFFKYGSWPSGDGAQYSCPHGTGIWFDERPNYSGDGETAHYRTKYDYPYSYDAFYLLGSPKTIEGCGCDYSDRMVQWSYSDPKYKRKWDRAMKAAKAVQENFHWSRATMGALLAFVKAYYGRGYVATGLVEWCNASTGYPLWSVFYREPKKRNPKPA